ncbi:hypothetical protein [Methylorubrum extorquens]|nr:hypothetical protein [Methylorubrum extorquens]
MQFSWPLLWCFILFRPLSWINVHTPVMLRYLSKILLVVLRPRRELLAPVRVPTAPPRSIRPPGFGSIRILSLATATREYAQRLAMGTFETARPTDLDPLIAAMGPEIWGWQYARRLTGQSAWRARPDVDERRERMIAADQMTADIELWERAIATHDRLAERARRYGDRPPDPLAVPSLVRDILAERQTAALQRAERRRRRGEGEGGGPEPVPDEAVRHPVPPNQSNPNPAA